MLCSFFYRIISFCCFSRLCYLPSASSLALRILSFFYYSIIYDSLNIRYKSLFRYSPFSFSSYCYLSRYYSKNCSFCWLISSLFLYSCLYFWMVSSAWILACEILSSFNNLLYVLSSCLLLYYIDKYFFLSWSLSSNSYLRFWAASSCSFCFRSFSIWVCMYFVCLIVSLIMRSLFYS